MALADFAAYRAALAGSGQLSHFRKAIAYGSFDTAVAGSWNKISYPVSGGTPSTATALDYTGVEGEHSLRHPAVASGRLCLMAARPLNLSGNPHSALVIDRLSHTGGLVGNVATEQFTNLPTAALTRYTDGVGVLMAVQVYSAPGSLGATPTTLSVSYTNQAGTPGRTGTRVLTTAFSLDKFYIVGFQQGDTGVRSVESVTMSNASTSAGNMGIVLFKPIALIPVQENTATTDIVGWNTSIHTEAHLEIMGNSNTTGVLSGELTFAEV